MRLLYAIAAALLLVSPAASPAWESVGRQIVGAVADANLNPGAAAHVRAHDPIFLGTLA